MKKPAASEIRVGGRRYIAAGGAAKEYGYHISAMHHFQRVNGVPAVIQRRRKYICESALRQAIQARRRTKPQMVGEWLREHPRATWESGPDLAAQMAKDGIVIPARELGRILRSIGKNPGRGPRGRKALAWFEEEPARRFLPVRVQRAALEKLLKRPVLESFVKQVKAHYDNKHGHWPDEFPAAAWARIGEVMEHAGVRRSTVLYWIERGEFRVERRLTRIFIERASLEAFLERRARRKTKTTLIREYYEQQPGAMSERLEDIARRFGVDGSLVGRVRDKVREAQKVEA